jgi:hypothetical protein
LVWFGLVMAGLKSFLNGIAPILGVSPLALYERQRALVNLGVLRAVPGRGPGSGVPLTPYNVAAVVISVLATDNLSEIDDRVVGIIRATPDTSGLGKRELESFQEWGRPSFGFCLAVGALLVGPAPIFGWPKNVYAIRVSRCWRAQVVLGRDGGRKIEFLVRDAAPPSPVHITAELEARDFERLSSFTLGALSQTVSEGEDG